MDAVIASLKQSLNDLEDRFRNQVGENYHSKMINYFVYSQEEASLTGIFSEEDNENESDDDDVSLESEALEDDMTSDSESDEDDNLVNDNRCGTVMELAWVKRSKALRTDIAIAGWMCSPHPDIMEDCINNTKGEHKLAVTRLFKQWFGHEVRTTIFIFPF